MTDTELIILLSKERFELQNELTKQKEQTDLYAKWWRDATKEIDNHKLEIQQLQQKLNDRDFATINTNEHPKHG
jgi:hypothetical protein